MAFLQNYRVCLPSNQVNIPFFDILLKKYCDWFLGSSTCYIQNNVAKVAITPHNTKTHKQKDEDLSINLFKFLRYYLFVFCQKIGFACSWPQMDYAKECKQQILKQLDIKLLLKRIIFIEHCLTYIIDDYQLDALQMKKPQTPKEIREIRLKCESIVDRQLSVSSSQQVLSIQQCQIRPQLIQSQALESPQVLASQFQPTKTNDMTKPTDDQKPGYIGEAVKKIKAKRIVTIDVQTIHDQSETSNYYIDNRRGKNEIQNSYKREKTRKIFLMQLQATAEEGNHISSKIWKNLDQKIKKSVTLIKTNQKIN